MTRSVDSLEHSLQMREGSFEWIIGVSILINVDVFGVIVFGVMWCEFVVTVCLVSHKSLNISYLRVYLRFNKRSTLSQCSRYEDERSPVKSA